MQFFRDHLSLPFLLLGAGCYRLAEWIAGKRFTWRGAEAAAEAVHNLRTSGLASFKGFRTPKRGHLMK